MTFDLPRPDILYSSNSVPLLYANRNKAQAWFLSPNKTRNQTPKRPINACNTCIRMKRRCDLKKPSCSLCEKRQRPCEYPKQTQTSTEPMTEASDVHGGGVALRASMVRTRLETLPTDIEDGLRHASTNPMKRSNVYSVLDSPTKRNKGNTLSTPTTSPADAITAQDCNLMSSNRGRYNTPNNRYDTPSRASAYFNLVYDALAANPQGLSSSKVFEWVRTHRPQALHMYDEKKLRTAIQGTLSAQSNKQQPTVWKYKDDDSDELGYIWKLADTVPLLEHTLTEKEPQLVSATDDINAWSRDCLGDDQASAPLSAARRSHTDQARDEAPVTTQTQKTSVDDDDQAPGTEFAVVNHEVNTEHVHPCITPSTEVLGHEFALAIPEHTTELIPTSATLTQQQPHVSNGNSIDTIVGRPGLPASDTEMTLTNGADSGESDDSDSEVQRQTAKLASELRKARRRRDRMKMEIATRIHALPDRKVMAENDVQAKERVTELLNLLEEARRAAATASRELDATDNETQQIKTAEQELEQVIGIHTTLRLQLNELTD